MKYLLRAVKYFLKLVVLLAIVFLLIRRGNGVSILDILATTNGKLFAAAVIIWCAIYPRVEFVTRSLSYDITKRKAAIVRALGAGGMTLVAEEEWKMTFHGSVLRRLWWLGEDTVIVRRNAAGGIDIEGPRRFAMEAQQRIPNYVQSENEG